MKNIFKIFVSLLLFTSCVNYNDATQETTVNIQLLQPTDYETTVDLTGKTVTATRGTVTLTAKTDANGIATFTGIAPDEYSFSTSWALSQKETLSGSISTTMITGETTLDMPTQVAINRDLVIGKIYFAGSKDNNNKNYVAGKFIELFNQSDDSIDVSGLYLGIVESESTPAYTQENLKTAYNDSVVLLKQIYRIPVNANKKVAPGGTILIVNSAIDHTTNNSMDHNLLDADFEVKDVQGKYQNNPETPAMEVIYNIYTGTSIMNMLQNGLGSYIIFRTDEDPTSWPKTYKYGKTSGNEWIVAPTRYILDGVESMRNSTKGFDLTTKRLWDYIDAGYTYIQSTTGYSGEIIYRKTSKTLNGHKILVDTNNSSNDFQVSKTIGTRNYDE